MDAKQQIEEATRLLEAIVEDRALIAELDPVMRERFLIAAGRVSKPDMEARRKLKRQLMRNEKREKRKEDRVLQSQAEIRQLRKNPIFRTPRKKGDPEPSRPSLGELHEQQLCYVCQNRYKKVHFFYDKLCLKCGDFNHEKRGQTADLTGRVALVTGSRLKIGYQAAIMLLRAGASVICVTRFPVDAAARYAAEDDFSEWGGRLRIHGVDLRHVPSVEAFCEQIAAEHTRLDFIINNACQTVRRPPAFYSHMMSKELSSDVSSEMKALVCSQRSQELHSSAALSQVPLLDEDHLDPTSLFPTGRLDADLQQVDLREMNSWRLRLADISTIELLEVNLVNVVAPFILNARLKPLMMTVSSHDKHIVNVSAMEGQFYRTYKSDKHPHTNMAKAALNMMTRTSAADYVEHGIHMNSVDTGWVTDEDPAALAEMKREVHNFHPPPSTLWMVPHESWTPSFQASTPASICGVSF